ncbi:hypothetical protein [Chitinimonas sp.]|uniref:hypothetical protein n=1 Tax=Chitinimonas sp. TaxID=1934313 RepID=UPI002F93EB83
MREFCRPWKLATFSLGLLWLLWGAGHYQLSDWDVGVSLLMAGFTFLTAPWAVRVLLTRDWRHWPAALLYTWWAVDGIYWVYHTLEGHPTLREAQWPTSLCLYLLCGCLWLWRGSLTELAHAVQQALRRQH